MKYSLDNTAYVINDSNYERLNQIYLKYWQPNGYQFESGRTVSAAYQHVKDILTDGPIHIVYNTIASMMNVYIWDMHHITVNIR